MHPVYGLYISNPIRMLEASVSVENDPGPLRPVPDVCKVLCSNIRGLSGSFGNLKVASSQYDILFCSVTSASDMKNI